MMQIIRAYIDSILKSNKIVIFVDDLKTSDQEQNTNTLNDLKDLLRVYQINEKLITVKFINQLQDSLNCKAYLNILCRRNKKINYPLVFINGKNFGSFVDMNKCHEDGTLFTIFRDSGLVKINHASLLGIDESSNIKASSITLPSTLIATSNKKYDYHSSYNDTDLNAITDVTLSNLDIGKSISQLYDTTIEKSKFTKSYNLKSTLNGFKFRSKGTSFNRSSKTSMALKGTDDSIATWNDDTLKSYSTLDTKFDYCLDYIRNNYNEQAKQLTPPTSKTSRSGVSSSHYVDISKRGLTPPNQVLSVIRGRLGRANAEIQSKSLKILNRKIPTNEY